MPLIELNDVFYSYPHTEKNVLKNIYFSIDKNEYVAILGLNGSGKSTLSRLLAGFFSPTQGNIKKQKEFLSGIVFQQPKEQIVAGIVERDTAFGPQNLNMTPAEIELRTIECLSVVSIVDKALCRTFELSLGQTQRLAFSGILALFPDLLILDEVTSMLDPFAKDHLLEFIDEWNKKGHAIIHVTHDLDEALKADRIVVMENGSIIFDGKASAFKNQKNVFEKIFGTNAEWTSFKKLENHKIEQTEIALKVQNLSFSYDNFLVFNNLSFELKKGSLVALTGPSGCGKSTLFECIAGLKKTSTGTIFATSRPAVCLQESEAALFEPYAADDVAFGAKNKNVSGKELLNRVKTSMELAGLNYKDFGNRPTFLLSGGEKRKLSIASLIALDSDILIFDEPTAGLDPISRKTILTSLRKLADNGKTVLFSTHRIQEVEAADFKLEWQNLNIPENSSSEIKENNLKQIEYIQNANILETVSKVSTIFSAPNKIPKSFISMLSPCIKTILFFMLFITSLSICSFFGCIVMIFINIFYALLAKYPLKKPLKIIFKILPWIALFAILGIFFFPVYESDKILFTCKFLVVTKSKLLLFARAFFHSICAVFAIGTYIYTTDERQIMDGISTILKPLAFFKIPVRYIVLVIGIIFRFIPLLLDELLGIIKTQIIRGTLGNAKGLKKLKAIIPIFVPLILQTIRKAQCLADALTARYFK